MSLAVPFINNLKRRISIGKLKIVEINYLETDDAPKEEDAENHNIFMSSLTKTPKSILEDQNFFSSVQKVVNYNVEPVNYIQDTSELERLRKRNNVLETRLKETTNLCSQMVDKMHILSARVDYFSSRLDN